MVSTQPQTVLSITQVAWINKMRVILKPPKLEDIRSLPNTPIILSVRASPIQAEKIDINGAISKWSQRCHPRGMALCVLLFEPLECLNWEKSPLDWAKSTLSTDHCL